MANSKTFPIFSGSLSFSGHFHFRKNRVYNNNNTAFSLDVSIFSFSFVFPYAKSSGICSPLNGATRRKNHFVFGRNETLFGSPAEDMGTGGKTFDAHVIPATYHHKHVRPMAGDDSDLRRGIGELLSRWGGLQMAVKNKWGGNDSLEKSQELAHHLFHLLSQTNVITVDEIESFLHESLLLSFNTEMEDGSIEEVAEQLMILHEESCLHGSH